MVKIKLILFICLSVILFGCNSNSNKSSSQSSSSQEDQTKIFNISSYDITVGDNIQLEYNAPEGVFVSFVSRDITVAKVTNTGLVSAVKEGSAVIEITLTINDIMQKDTCIINVTDKDINYIKYTCKTLYGLIKQFNGTTPNRTTGLYPEHKNIVNNRKITLVLFKY